MVSKLQLVISAIIPIIFLEIANCQNHRQFENPMKDFNRCLSSISVNKKLSRDHCFAQLCNYVPGLFQCKVLQCKKKFPRKNDTHKKSMVRCVKGVCGSRPSESLCQGIRKCERLKKGIKEEREYSACVVTLFPEK